MNSREIPPVEVRFHPCSFSDSVGRLFWWRGELYRGITASGVALYERIIRDGTVARLVEQGLLIETRLTDLSLDGFSIVLQHRTLPFVSYPNCWCPSMLRDAACVTADLVIELERSGLTLTDAAAWNVLFDGGQPVFVDFSSIVPAQSLDTHSWRGYDDLLTYFLLPLELSAQGFAPLARWVLADYEHGPIQSNLLALWAQRTPTAENAGDLSIWRSVLKSRAPSLLRRLTMRVARTTGSAQTKTTYRADRVRQLRDTIARVPVPSAAAGFVVGETSEPPLLPSDPWTEKHRAVHRVLASKRPATVLDVGCGNGWYARLAAQFGSAVVAVDSDERWVEACYLAVRTERLPILPLVMDIRYPSPGQGIGNDVLAPASQRLRCELVLMLGLVHILVFKHYHRLEQIAATLATFAKKMALVEFIPPSDPEVRTIGGEEFSWYTLDNFTRALQEHFHSVEAVRSHPQGRMLLFCEK